MSDESIPPARAHGERLQTTDDTVADAPAAAPGATAEAEAGIGPRRRRGVALGIAAAAIVAVIAAPLGALAVSDARGAAEVALDAAGGLAGSAAAAGSEPAEDLDGVDLHIAPTLDTTITPGAPLAISVEIENSTAEALAPGTVRLTRADGPIDSTGELDAWLGTGGDADERRSSSRCCCSRPSRARSPRVRPRSCRSPCRLTRSAPPTTGPCSASAPRSSSTARSSRRQARPSPRSTASASDPTSLAIVYPLTVPAESAGIFTAEQLEAWTAPLGLLDRQLDAVDGKQVAIGIDPRIIASIRVLGSAAPASADAWLARLGALPNETFPLAYADADVARAGPARTARAADADDLLRRARPRRVHRHEPPPVDPAETATPTPTPTPPTRRRPTRPTRPMGVPTTEAILAWPYTRTDIAWPADDTVASGDLGYLAAAGLTTAIVAPGNVDAARRRLDAASTIDGLHRCRRRRAASRRPCAPRRPRRPTSNGAPPPGACSPSSPSTPDPVATRHDCSRRSIAAGVRERRSGRRHRSTRSRATRGSTPAGLSDAIGAPPVARARSSMSPRTTSVAPTPSA